MNSVMHNELINKGIKPVLKIYQYVSLPTFANASAINFPMVSSLFAEIVATCLSCPSELMSWEISLRNSLTTSLTAKSISRFGFDIQAVVISTLGAEAFDTLYITTTSGEPLTEERAKLLATQVESALITYR